MADTHPQLRPTRSADPATNGAAFEPELQVRHEDDVLPRQWRSLAMKLAHRLRRLAIDRSDEDEAKRHAVLQREVESVLGSVESEWRERFLAELAAHFPSSEDDLPPAWWAKLEPIEATVTFAGGTAEPEVEIEEDVFARPIYDTPADEAAALWARLAELRGEVSDDDWYNCVAQATEQGLFAGMEEALPAPPTPEPPPAPVAAVAEETAPPRPVRPATPVPEPEQAEAEEGDEADWRSDPLKLEMTNRYWKTEPALRRRWQLTGKDVIDPTRALELVGVLGPHTVLLDRFARGVWEQLAPPPVATLATAGGAGSPLTEQRLLRGLMSQVRIDGNRLRQDVAYQRSLVTGLVGAVNGLGRRLHARVLGRIDPMEIERTIRDIEGGGGWGGDKAVWAKCWSRYEQLFAEVEADRVDEEVARLVAEYVGPILAAN